MVAPAQAVETWEKLDKRLKQQVMQLNVAVKLRLKDGTWLYWTDASPKFHFPIFATTKQDNGFQVFGFGSSFPVKTLRRDGTYFVTNRHVVESADNIVKECERFHAAIHLYAEQSAAGKDVNTRYKELLQIVDLPLFKKAKDWNADERVLYQSTIDSIWDTYEQYLSVRADPGRLLFKKYLAMAGVQSEVGYFLHQVGPATQKPIEAKLVKCATSDDEPDIAILKVNNPEIPAMDLETLPPSEGQEVQVIGYPTASDKIDKDSSKYFSPTFTTGRISRVAPRMLQVDAPITTGNSGGPVVNLRGKVVGIVANRAVSALGGELPNFGGAVTVQSLQSFAPEYFGRTASK